ncbi:hypothetical protein JOM56_007652 [Amanita muscaria]
MVLTNNRSSDARVITLLERILEAIEALNNSIQESTRFMNSQPSPIASSFVPSGPPPSLASSARSTGVPSVSYSSVSLSGALEGVSLHDKNKYHKHNIPCSQRWYCVIRGRRVGPIQGWENVEDLTDGLNEAKYQCCVTEAEAHEVYQRALSKLGNVRILN